MFVDEVEMDKLSSYIEVRAILSAAPSEEVAFRALEKVAEGHGLDKEAMGRVMQFLRRGGKKAAQSAAPSVDDTASAFLKQMQSSGVGVRGAQVTQRPVMNQAVHGARRW